MEGLAPENGFLPVRVGSSWRAMELAAVVEILDWQEPMPLPGAPPEVLGVMAHCGHTVPVIALSRCLDPSEDRDAPVAFPRIVVVAVLGMRVGCRCDEVRSVGEEVPPCAPLDLVALLEPLASGRTDG